MIADYMLGVCTGEKIARDRGRCVERLPDLLANHRRDRPEALERRQRNSEHRQAAQPHRARRWWRLRQHARGAQVDIVLVSDAGAPSE
jgi:hypothetical protein